MTDSHRTEPEGFEPFERTAPTLSADGTRTMAKNDPTSSPGWERATLEKLAFAAVREQRATRRWKTFVRLSWLAFFVFLLWFSMSRGTPATAKATPHTAVIEIKGEIAAGADASAEFVVAAMKTASAVFYSDPVSGSMQAGMSDRLLKRPEFAGIHGVPVKGDAEPGGHVEPGQLRIDDLAEVRRLRPERDDILRAHHVGDQPAGVMCCFGGGVGDVADRGLEQ